MKFASGSEFLDWRDKRLAFIGMSGVGKSTLAGYLNPDQWQTFCTDYSLAVGPLRSELEAFAGEGFIAAHDDISVLSGYVGKLGARSHGGLELEEFRRRQHLHGLAERQTFLNLVEDLSTHSGPAIIDAGGSLVEILEFEESDPLIDALQNQMFFIYIEADDAKAKDLIDRQLLAPKPMFYRPAFLETALAEYGAPIEAADPNDFIRFVFPRLIAARRPKYERLAQTGGVSIPLTAANKVRSDEELLNLIAEHIDHAH